MVPIMCMATVGQVSNPLHFMEKLGKAGAARRRGIRPTVRLQGWPSQQQGFLA